MVAASGVEILILLLFFSPVDILPHDVLSIVQADAGLAILGEKSDPESLEKLILAGLDESGGEVRSKVSSATESAIQNLASSSEKVRQRAREKLVAEGPGILKRLSEVVEGDPRRAAEAKKVIAELEGKKAAARHAVYLAQQFALRHAASEKLTQLMPAVRRATRSSNFFVRQAAEDALARLDPTYASGEAVRAPTLGLQEIEALPAETRVLLSFRLKPPAPGASGGVTIQSFIAKLAPHLPAGAGPEESDIHEACEAVIGWVKSYGNMRPEWAFITNVGAFGPQGGGIGIILQGIYEPAVLRETLGKSPLWTTSETAGYTVYNSSFLRLVLLSDRSALLLPPMASARFPLNEYLAALAAGRKPLMGEKRLGDFVRALASPIRARGLAITDERLMSSIYEEMRGGAPQHICDAVESMRHLSLTVAEAAEGKVRLRLEAEFSGKEAASDLAQFARQSIDQGIAALEAQLKQTPVPGGNKLLDILKAIKVSAEGEKGLLRFEAPKLELEEVMMPILFTTRRVERVAR